MLGRLSLLRPYLLLARVMKFLCDIKLGELGALQVKSLHQNWIRQQPSTSSRQPSSSTYHIRGLWYAYFRVMFLKCRAASSFIRDLGTRTFIILDVIWTCQFLPQWPLSLDPQTQHLLGQINWEIGVTSWLNTYVWILFFLLVILLK